MDRIVRIARKVLVGVLTSIEFGDKVDAIFKKYRFVEMQKRAKWSTTIEEDFDYVDGDGKKWHPTFEVELSVTPAGNLVKLEMTGYTCGSWSDYEPDIRDEQFKYATDDDAARRIDKFVQKAKAELHRLCKEIEKGNK